MATITAMELRKLAQSYGFKNVARYKKDVLERMVAEREAEIAAAEKAGKASAAAIAKLEAESAAKPAKQIPADRVLAAEAKVQTTVKDERAKAAKKAAAPKQGKRCEICNQRPAGGKDAKANGLGQYCDPCYEEANWENTHSDNGHFDADAVLKGYESQEVLDACWICHPELNQASAAYVARQGTSREGMRLVVPVRGAAQDKVAAVAGKLPEGTQWEAKHDKKAHLVMLTIMCGPVKMTLAWHEDGAYAYDATSAQRDANSKVVKVRNASAALRILGV